MNKDTIKIVIIGIVTGLINGLFGSGGGTIIVPALIFLLSIEEHKSHATAIMIILPLTIISAYIYFKNNIIELNSSIIVMFGGVLGGFIGAKLLNKLSSNSLRKMFGIFMIVAALRLVI